MIGICYRYVVVKQIAEDLAHDAFLIAMEKYSGFKGIGSFNAWLRRITVNVALQYLRDKKKENRIDNFLLNEKFYWENNDKVDKELLSTQYNFSEQELLKVINLLPEHHRLVFNLYVIDNFTHAQIGEILNISPGTSRSHLARARKKIKRTLHQITSDKEKKKRSVLIPFIVQVRNIDKIYIRHFKDYKLQTEKAFSDISSKSQNAVLPVFSLLPLRKIILISAIISITILLGLFNFKFWEQNKYSNNDSISATNSKNTIILNDNLKNQKSMNNLRKFGLVLVAASSMGLDTVGQIGNNADKDVLRIDCTNQQSTDIQKSFITKQNNKIYRTYYFRDNSIDSLCFLNDSIYLSKNRIDYENPRLEFFNDTKFCFVYNVKLDTIQKVDNKTGLFMTQIIETSDKLIGKHGLLQTSNSKNESRDVSLRLKFKSGDIIDYDILDRKEQIILIRK